MTRHVFRFVALFVLLAGTAAAQSVSGSISGTITDPSRQVVPGATITLIEESTAAQRTVQSNETGVFVFTAVRPGLYTVRVEMSGFSIAETKHITLPANEQLSLGTIALAIGGISETITTTSEGSFVQTTSSERSALLTDKQLEMVAVRGRDVVSLLRVLPGVSYQGESEAPGGSFGTTTPNISGNRNSWNTVTVDGLVGNDLGSPQIFSGTINFDAIGEVKVQLNNYQAENGRNGGAMISVVTKSGTKDYKGSAYVYKRHEKLNANDFFNNRSGIAKPLYRYTTLGATLGGPVPGSWRDKLFFFYSFENWDTKTPQPVRRVTVPTALERQGDFSQSFTQAGALIVIRDPVTGAAFPNNKIPAERINTNGVALLNVFPLPNATDRAVTGGNYNYQFQESLDVPRHQHLGRVDFRPTAKDAIYTRASTWYADNQGFAVPAGAANWGLLGQHYTFKDFSLITDYTRILSSALVNEVSVGYRHSTEAGSALSQQGLDAVTRSHIGYTLGQFNPSINPLGIIPVASFSGAIANPAAITFEGRFPLTGADTFVTVNDTLSLARGSHTYKAGFYLEHARNEEGKTGTFSGNYEFNVDTTNPFDTRHPYANALIGSFRSYTESSARPGGDGTANVLEWFAQDTWRATRKLTLDYGARFGWYTNWVQKDGAAAAFSLERYDPKKAPQLYQPTLVGTARLALNPVTGQTAPAVLIGALVPGTGDPNNGLVLGSDSSYPKGFRNQAPVLVEPRVGFSFDPTGRAKTAFHGSFGIFHNTRVSGNVNWQASRNPPLQLNSQIFYGTMNTLLQSTGSVFPSTVQGFDQEIQTPTLYSYSSGFQHDIGWNTVVDVAYVGSQTRHLLQTRNLNVVPYGARFLAVNQDPTRPGSPLPDNFFRPFPGYGDINFFENTGIADYNALQLQANRRFTHGVQFGVAYTLSRSRDYSSGQETGTNPGRLPTYANVRDFTYGLSSFDQTHVAVINYLWDLPKASTLWNNPVVRAVLDNWQMSGITAFASGTPSGVSLSLVDSGTDLTGGGDGTRVVVTGDPSISNPSFTRWFDTSVFGRPARGDRGNGKKDIIRMPGVNNTDVTFFKRIPFGGGRRTLQLRWEMYNVFNHTQFNGVDTTARFDAAGKQVNPTFGQVTSTRSPRIMQGSLRFSF
ncbi:MAG TPA: carboxypeptidase-like regulatory domain-containing protein [Vicinamibacterales bacterium]|nr:carboxypeptidase-like regulatory domain-containing protein [Vicinamibacterales bacterium]